MIGGPDSLLCACGAQWHGAQLLERASEIVREHRARWLTGQAGCGPITHADYKWRFRCGCDNCKAERFVRRRMKRSARERRV